MLLDAILLVTFGCIALQSVIQWRRHAVESRFRRLATGIRTAADSAHGKEFVSARGYLYAARDDMQLAYAALMARRFAEARSALVSGERSLQQAREIAAISRE